MPSKSQRRRPATPIRQLAPGELDETRPHSITEVASKMLPESASPGMAQLNYACLLVPRFTAHYMTGDLADRMSEWMPNVCIAFGWRLEFLAVRPEYLQWVVNVTPNTSPGYLMRIMRQQTSEKTFREFPRLKRDNPSGDFWAPGYLIMGGIQPHPPQLVKDYIRQTRQRQGISQPRRW
jgi:REP element-mobilizing transposase RayT